MVEMDGPSLVCCQPWIYARDVSATVEYLIRTLGFAPWFDEGDVAGVTRGGVHLRVMRHPRLVDVMVNVDPPLEVRIRVQGVLALHAEHQAKGALIAIPLGTRPWGDTEYTIREPNGSYVTFTQDEASVRATADRSA
jgi:hypothetical protein